MSVNIGGQSEDKSYRYRMPKLRIKVEGKGNGIKTAVTNIMEISRALHCDPLYPTKYWGFELGSASSLDTVRNCAFLNGKRTAKELKEMLAKFIELFILCGTCKLPELSMKIKKTGVKVSCAACGSNEMLKTGHKLETFIVNAYAKNKKAAKTSKKDKKNKKDKKKNKKNKKHDDENEQDLVEEKVVWLTDTSEEAQKLRRKEEFEAKQSFKKIESMITTDSQGKKAKPGDIMKQYVKGQDRTPQEIYSQLNVLKLSRDLDYKTCILIGLSISLVSTSPSDFIKSVKDFSKPFYGKLCQEQEAQVTLLRCFELWTCAKKYVKYLPLVVKTFYEDDVLSEEAIVEWYQTPKVHYLGSSGQEDLKTAQTRGAVKPIIEWLQNADEESDSGSSSGEGEGEEGSEDEIDLDDI